MDFSVPPSWLSYINSAGVLGLFVLITYTGFKRVWHTHGEFVDMQNIYTKQITDLTVDRNEWKEKAGKAIDTNESQADQLGRLTSIVESLTNKAV